ncbi:hypothetical protein HDV05_002378, partial [Chytridiales sp. JEL 0842]
MGVSFTAYSAFVVLDDFEYDGFIYSYTTASKGIRILYLISGLVYLVMCAFDVFGLYAAYTARINMLSIFAKVNWIRLVLLFIFYIANYFWFPLALVFLIIWMLVQTYFQVCVWSYYLDARKYPNKYAGQPVKFTVSQSDPLPMYAQQQQPMPDMYMQQQQQQQPMQMMPQQQQQQPMMMMGDQQAQQQPTV